MRSVGRVRRSAQARVSSGGRGTAGSATGPTAGLSRFGARTDLAHPAIQPGADSRSGRRPVHGTSTIRRAGPAGRVQRAGACPSEVLCPVTVRPCPDARCRNRPCPAGCRRPPGRPPGRLWVPSPSWPRTRSVRRWSVLPRRGGRGFRSWSRTRRRRVHPVRAPRRAPPRRHRW